MVFKCVRCGVKGINEIQRRKGSSEGKKDKASFRDVYRQKNQYSMAVYYNKVDMGWSYYLTRMVIGWLLPNWWLLVRG